MFEDADVPELTDYFPVRIEENNMKAADRGVRVEDFTKDYFHILSTETDKIVELHFHPGYIDQFIVDHSTLVLPRCRDLATCIDPKVKQWVIANQIDLISFGDLKR